MSGSFIYFARYGNVGFSMKNMFGYEGIIRSEGLKIYFIEVIEHWKQSACRFLVTTDTYPQLREYNPRIPGGPLYYHYESREFYYLKTIKRHDGSIIANRNVVEILCWLQILFGKKPFFSIKYLGLINL